MKILQIVFLVLFMATLSFGQNGVFSGSASAGLVNQPVEFNCDFVDPLGLPFIDLKANFRGSGDTQFDYVLMDLMNEPPFYLATYEAETTFNTNPGVVEYYFSAQSDTLMATQSPKNNDNSFPPEDFEYADFLPDATGDLFSGDDDWLDLTGSGMTYSDTKVFAYMENVEGAFPINELLDFYIYAIGFVPLEGFDSTMYAMVYANIPFVMTPGVYSLSLPDTSFERLGDVYYQVENGRLNMMADLADFENDPDWPGWPPPNGFYMTMAMTLTMGFSSQALNDITIPTLYEPETYYIDFDNNNAPTLTNWTLDMIPDVALTAYVDYTDIDNNLPLERILFFNWGFYEMGSFDHTYDDGATFQYTMPYPAEGWSYYHFEFTDGVDTVETPVDSVYITAIGIDDDQTLPAVFNLDQNYPNPFNASTNISFTLDKPSEVELTIYDVQGREVATAATGYYEAGYHSVTVKMSDIAGQNLNSGIYFYRLTAGESSQTRKMIYLK